MLERFKGFFTRIIAPLGNLLLRAHVTPDMVTWVGAAGVAAAALWFFPRGHFFAGAVIVAAFALSDMLDGYMARASGQSSVWGAFLDSTLDRVGDAAIFGGIALWYAGPGDSTLYLCLALTCLVFGMLTSYVRARAEGLGMQAKGGIAERSDRLVVILLATGFAGLLDLPVLQQIALWLLAVAGVFTVGQRILMVRAQTRDRAETADED
jgi:CDP-diacylglycerol---glycerol-3-phosphate 3-phosphatidyltransferase